MIQRIQSIFLLLASVVLGLLFVKTFSFANIDSNLMGEMGNDGKFNLYDNVFLALINGISIAIFLLSIFLFKNRSQQQIMVRLGILLQVILIGIGIFLIVDNSSIGSKILNELSLDLGIGLPLIAMLLGWLASRSIKKDENLVKSMDRLR